MIGSVIAYFRRNLSEVINLIEAILRLAGSIASLTPTPKDDSIIDAMKTGFGKVKDFLEGIAG